MTEKRCRRGRLILAAALLGATAAAQQDAASHGAASKPKAVPPTPPVYNIVLSPNRDISITVPDEIKPEVEQCDGSGNPYFSVARDDDLQFVGLTPKGAVTFTASKITDIPSPHMQKAFVAPSAFLALTLGRESEKQEGQESNPIKEFMAKGEMRIYVARFNLDGSYRGALRLDLKILPMQFAAFESGGLLIAGLDHNNVARVALMDPSGELLRYLELPKDIAENPRAVERTCGNSFLTMFCGDMSSVAMSAGFVPYKGNILFFRNLDSSRIYEIRDSGEVRMVRIRNAADLDVEGLLPSDQDWFVDSGDELYELNPETGERLGRYRLARTSQQDKLACAFDGKFVGLRHQDGKMMLLSGVAQPVAQKPVPPGAKN